MKSYDAIVIGAGPAGATAAAIVADRDMSTLLIEKERGKPLKELRSNQVELGPFIIDILRKRQHSYEFAP